MYEHLTQIYVQFVRRFCIPHIKSCTERVNEDLKTWWNRAEVQGNPILCMSSMFAETFLLGYLSRDAYEESNSNVGKTVIGMLIVMQNC